MERNGQDNCEISKEVHWFLEMLEKEFHVKAAAGNIGLEATELSTDEVADFFVPTELFEEVPATFLYEVMIVDDEEQNEWVGAIAFYPDTSNWCLQVITRNDEIVFRKVLSSIN
ncbi:hypothetical protein [Planococcus soli]|uniref:hypothetical protein n=1 Tax=Planococcus soli TaxID=2666072 RepID=UPI00115D0FDE|nr:hypothetical protein [Planococcus soli]